MDLPLNLAVVLIVSYEYLFCLSLSEQLWLPAQWKALGLPSGSCTPGTAGHRFQPKYLDIIGFLLWQTAGEPSTPYWIQLHHSWMKRRGHQLKKNKTQA
jgi:hypothetical protein